MMQTVLTRVDAGEGVALVPVCVSSLRSSGIVLRPVQPDTARIPLMMVLPAGQESPALGPFLDLQVSSSTSVAHRRLEDRRRRHRQWHPTIT